MDMCVWLKRIQPITKMSIFQTTSTTTAEMSKQFSYHQNTMGEAWPNLPTYYMPSLVAFAMVNLIFLNLFCVDEMEDVCCSYRFQNASCPENTILRATQNLQNFPEFGNFAGF